jgi:hypothetical protein
MVIFNSLAALLVVGVLIGASLFLFRLSRQSPKVTIGVGTASRPVTTQVTSNGLELTMSVTPGPYFLSELIAVDMSLTNQTQATIHLQSGNGLNQEFMCDPPLRATLTGGSIPKFSLWSSQTPIMVACTTALLQTSLTPGQTITTRQFVALTVSGQNALTVELSSPGFAETSLKDAFKANPLSMQLNVMASVPDDRNVLSLQRSGSAVQVTVSSSANLQLLDTSFITCQLTLGGVTQLEPRAGSIEWASLPMHTLNAPDSSWLKDPETSCEKPQWIFDVGAVGYAIVTGNTSS